MVGAEPAHHEASVPIAAPFMKARRSISSMDYSSRIPPACDRRGCGKIQRRSEN